LRRRRDASPAHAFHHAALEDLAQEVHFAYRVRRGMASTAL